MPNFQELIKKPTTRIENTEKKKGKTYKLKKNKKLIKNKKKVNKQLQMYKKCFIDIQSVLPF